MGIFDKRYGGGVSEEMTLAEYLEKAKTDASLYATPAERMLKAIGEPEMVDTRLDRRLGMLNSNAVIPVYPAFKEFYGMEKIVQDVVSFFKHSAQGLEESKQVLYLLGPVSGGKSSISEKLKSLMEKEPFYAIKGSPIHENPLGLFTAEDAEELGIPERYLTGRISPWLTKQINTVYKGDISKLTVVKLYPSQHTQLAVAKTEPGDENNQDISTLTGKVNIRKLREYDQDDPDAYSYSGGLCRANRGLLEFVEMFKAPIKVLNPLLTATQEHNYNPTESMPSIPFEGVILAHSNESEWDAFKNNKQNEAFLDRIAIVKVPYVLRATETVSIFKKYIRSSGIANAKIAPQTLEMLSEFITLTRLEEPGNSSIYVKQKTYDGENLKLKEPSAKSLKEYKDAASQDEGMSGLSNRWAFKVLSTVCNFDHEEIAANPVHLLLVLQDEIIKGKLPKDKETKYMAFIKEKLVSDYVEYAGQEIRRSYLENHKEHGQAIFDKYIKHADNWMQDKDYRDPETGIMYDIDDLNTKLSAIEKKAQISNPKDFRHDVVNFALRYQASHKGENPSWESYEKIRDVIEQNVLMSIEELLPIVSLDAKSNKDDQQKHNEFIARMVTKGYTAKQVRLIVSWYQSVGRRSGIK